MTYMQLVLYLMNVTLLSIHGIVLWKLQCSLLHLLLRIIWQSITSLFISIKHSERFLCLYLLLKSCWLCMKSKLCCIAIILWLDSKCSQDSSPMPVIFFPYKPNPFQLIINLIVSIHLQWTHKSILKHFETEARFTLVQQLSWTSHCVIGNTVWDIQKIKDMRKITVISHKQFTK